MTLASGCWGRSGVEVQAPSASAGRRFQGAADSSRANRYKARRGMDAGGGGRGANPVFLGVAPFSGKPPPPPPPPSTRPPQLVCAFLSTRDKHHNRARHTPIS